MSTSYDYQSVPGGLPIASPTVASITAVLYETASEPNGCIDKFRLYVNLLSTATSVKPGGVVYLTPCPTSVYSQGDFDNSGDGYVASGSVVCVSAFGSYIGDFNVENTLGGFYISDDGYVSIGGAESVNPIVEVWFHRTLPDISSPAFASEFPDNGADTNTHIYHYSQAQGFVASLNYRYRYWDFGTGSYVYNITSTTIELLSYYCGDPSPSDPDPDPDTLPSRDCLVAPPVLPSMESPV